VWGLGYSVGQPGQMILNSIQNLNGSNMVLNDLKKGTTFSIGTFSDSKWISNEKLEKLLGLEFNRIY
jgi:hypothetical protein